MDLKEIKSIIDLMTKAGLSEFELEKGDFKLRVKRGPNGEWSTSSAAAAPQVVHHHAPMGAFHAPVAPVAHAPVAAAAGSAAPASGEASGHSQIVSPMVGTFYIAPSPESPPYVTVGQEVQEDTVVCIIEAMKVMNEIKAETRGVIVEVLAANGKPVEFGKPLFAIRPL
ncbi:MAG TPA: acetyl-CoA carboxylase biotin carboxyl carrier protein [Candidatus Methylacidiphilales bacterium]|jgi:acetyl-CoA carboxylase biotin carboxyl carrier protein|nr:acetyl-CoA carboxylase biotin carboxyl carrier protein [Candidatus Methylacidiphilales bacterium]